MTTPVIGEGEKLITTVLLNGERLHVRIHATGTAQDLFDHVVNHMVLREITYFGLMIIKDGEHQFLELEERLSKLSKYAPHLWKDDSSCNSSLVFTVFFRVKYYVENICLLQEQATRHQYYLQLRKDVLENNIRIHDDTAMVLASYALQAELGDHNRSVHGIEYFVPQHYLPPKTISKLTIPYIKNALPAMHQSHRSLSEAQAEIEFLKEAQKLSEYGVLFHRVFKKEYNRKVPYSLGICVRGLIIYEDTGVIRNPIIKHPWNKIGKMSFKKCKFLVTTDSTNPANSNIVLYTSNYKRSRYLLRMCSAFFNFQMMMSVRLSKFQDMPDSASTPLPTVRIENHLPTNGLTSNGTPLNGRRGSSPRDEYNGFMGNELKPLPKPEVKQYFIELTKEGGSFGFSIVGGIELGGIFVKDLTRNSPAATCKKISPGDRIVQVNKVSFENVTRREAIQTLRNAPDKSKFTMETFGQINVIEADPSMMTPLTLSASSLAAGGAATAAQIAHAERHATNDLIRVDLAKKDGSFGVGFTGGPELGGIYVKSMLPRGAAEMNGRIALGDRLVEVNSRNVEHFTRKQVLELLKISPPIVPLVLERYQLALFADNDRILDMDEVLRSNPNFVAIVIHKNHEGLGFNVTGGLDLGGIFIKSLSPNGPAAMDGRVEVGDRIVAVGNTNLETATRQRALEVIRNAPNPVSMIIEKCIPLAPGMSQMQSDALFRSDSTQSLPLHGGNGGPMMMDRYGRPPQTRNFAHSMQDLPRTVGDVTYHPGNHGSNYAINPYPRELQDGVDNFVSQLFPSHAKNIRTNTNDSAHRQIVNQEVFVVDLPRLNGGFGVSLTGGPEIGGIFVKAIQEGGSAYADGRMQKGDRIMEINGRRMDRLSKREASDWLKSSSTIATLVLERLFSQQQFPHLTSNDGEYVSLELHRTKESFGLCLTGGPELHGIYVKSLLAGSSSEHNERIGKGDRLVEVNGVNLDGFTRLQAIELLKNSPAAISVVVEKTHFPDDMAAILEADLYVIDLMRGTKGYGLSLTGGIELGGIYVKGILPGSEADVDGRISTGDRVVEINGMSVDMMSKLQAIDLVRQSSRQVNLLMERFATYDNMIVPESDFFTVEVQKKNGSYGLGLTGGPEIFGIYIKSVQQGGAAYEDGRIERGDRIVSVNGVSFEEITRQQASDVLKGIDGNAILLIERCVVGNDVPPLDTVLTVVELNKKTNGFGFNLTGGPDLGGVYVKALLHGGSAEADKRIELGDRLVEINGLAVDGMPRMQVLELLKNAPQRTAFVFERIKQSKSEGSLTQSRCGAFTPVKSQSKMHSSMAAMSEGNPGLMPGTSAGALLPGLGLAGIPHHRLSTQSAPGYFNAAQTQQRKSPIPPSVHNTEQRRPSDASVASRLADEDNRSMMHRSSHGDIRPSPMHTTQNGTTHKHTPQHVQRSNSWKESQRQPSPSLLVKNPHTPQLGRSAAQRSSPSMISSSSKGMASSQSTLIVGSRESGFRAMHNDMQRLNSAVSNRNSQSGPIAGSPNFKRKTQGLQPVNGGSSSGPVPGKVSPKSHQNMFSLSQDDDSLIEVVLYKGSSGLGIILGGGGNEGPLSLKRIAPGSSADECGQLKAGDILLKVNGTPVAGMGCKEATSLLRSCTHEVQVLVSRPSLSNKPSSMA